MGKRPLGLGLIGVGRHGLRYARHILHDLPSVSLKAVCRRNPAQGLDLPGAESVTVYGQARALIEDPAVEAIIVVTPPIFTREICKVAVQARKPLLVEKPLAASAADAKALVSEAQQAGVPLMTAQTLRFDSAIQEMRKRGHLIGRSERLRLTSHIETKATAPGHADGYGKRGALLEIGVHMLDLVRFLTGEEVQEVRCTMDRLPPTAPDTVVSAQLTTVGGTTCLLDIARVTEGRVGSAEWVGLQGRLQVDWISHRLRWIGNTDRQEWEFPSSQTVRATLMAFLEAVEQRTPMPITGEDGLRAVEIAEACYRSAESGGALVVLQAPT
ncbi:MAG: Gfo/Idh/MocA family oxidoreductase [Nitrospira sp.]|nr:Gfo/Idh/MocA family oxidoreductase [Nitrospira sp.]MBH0181481.1 Gfo/Idh/MocA family oxidoreductase [Nitrospira sp.]MBH0186035.1 Gfo/Idh/MocA family oxidoreductase [Nitrospira sp.]